MSILASRTTRVILVVVVQLGLVAAAVNGQLSARLTGDEYLFRVQPVDPIDPFRGAYVDLNYPDLVSPEDDGMRALDRGEEGDVYLPLEKKGQFWQGAEPTRTRPSSGPYLKCSDDGWTVECGIESWFLPQDKALALEEALQDGEVVARVKIDGRGNAALVAVEPR